MLTLLIWVLVNGAIGALAGLIPYFLCKSQGKDNMAQLALVCCAVGGIIVFGLALLIAIGFGVAAFVSAGDTRPVFRRGQPAPASPPPGGPAYYEYNDQSRLGLRCLSGSMKGRVYRVGSDGMMIGRDYDCGVRFDPKTPGISRHHCSIRWYQGGPALVDLGSSYGSYLADGRKLPPNYPVPAQVGTRFYLGSPGNMFELIRMQ